VFDLAVTIGPSCNTCCGADKALAARYLHDTAISHCGNQKSPYLPIILHELIESKRMKCKLLNVREKERKCQLTQT